MLTGFGVRNFKAFGESSEPVRLAPITLIFGPNSSGKSVFLQSLFMTKNFLERGKKELELPHLTVKDGVHDHGSVLNLFNKHVLSKAIDFEFFFPPTPDVKKREFRKMVRRVPEFSQFRIRMRFKSKKGKDGYLSNPFLESILYGKKTDSIGDWDTTEMVPDKHYYQDDPPYINAPGFGYKVVNPEGFKPHQSRCLSRHAGLLPKIFSHNDFSHVHPVLYDLTLEGYGALGEFVEQVDDFNDIFDSLTFIGPHRNEPLRIYRQEDKEPATVGPDGSGWIYLVMKMQEEDSLKNLNSWLENLHLPYKIEVNVSGNDVSGFFLGYSLEDRNSKIELSLNDVGFGLCQVLPILVEGIERNNGVILVEQPELHLHPKLQADLADFFIENSKANENQWIIETHSELLILRVLRHIRRGLLSPEDVSVLYVNPGKDGSEISELRIDEKGDFIDPWPHGFFDEDVVELFGD